MKSLLKRYDCQTMEPVARTPRPLIAGEPEIHPFQTADGVDLTLLRYKGGDKGPVMLVHGLGVSAKIFNTDMINTNLVEFLYAKGYDIWLIELRVSIDLDASNEQWTGDELAKNDYPAAVNYIRNHTNQETIQAVVHCYGATTFFMSMLSGLEGIRSIVCSQIATHAVIPKATQLKTGLHIPSFLQKLGVDSLNAQVDGDENIFEQLYDKALSIYALGEAQGYCSNATCHRITFMYGSLYRHDRISHLLHDNLNELFGVANIKTFQHLAQICRKGHLVDFDGNDVYLANLSTLDLPILFISGEDNECYLPESTAITYDLLKHNFGEEQYSRKLIPGYGHIDCIFGKDAHNDVYPYILAHLEKTA